jgi:hypothetical protein
MPSIVSYRKFINAQVTRELAAPDGATELATLADGTTYVCLPEAGALPVAQHAEIVDSIASVTPDATLRAQIIAASPHCRLIDERMRTMIRDAYPLEDELKFARIGVGAAMGVYQPTSDEVQAMTVFGEFVEGVRQWGRDQRTSLGL